MPSKTNSGKRFVLLDRDGVLNEDKYVTYQPDTQLKLIDGVPEGLSCLQALGFEFIILTNQTAAGKGWITKADVERFNRALIDALAQHGIDIAAIYVCYEPDGFCRKPYPGMFFEAQKAHDLNLAQCYFIGDKMSDVLAGHNAGCKTILVETGVLDDEGKYPNAPSPDFRVRDLPKAAQAIAGELALEQMRLTGTFVSPFTETVCRKLTQSR